MHTLGGRARPLALTVGLLWAGLGHAQAWLPPAATGSVSMSYTDSFVTKHYFADGSERDVGHIHFFTYGLSGTYSPTDKLMLSASLPLVESKYYGPRPHPTEVDDFRYHATATDLRTELHYQLLLEPVAIAPYIAYVLPTHHYETLGHAAPGRDLHELWLGAALGKSLDAWIRRTYIESRFTYAQAQKVWDPSHVWYISHNKWYLDFDAGYFVTPDLNVTVLYHWQRSLGGVSVPAPAQLFPIHDRAGMENYSQLGVGAAWSYSDRSAFSFNILRTLEGRNGHKLDHAISVAYSYEFGRNH